LRDGTPDSAAIIAGTETSSAEREGGGVLGLKEGVRGVEGVESPSTRAKAGMERLSWDEEVSVDDMWCESSSSHESSEEKKKEEGEKETASDRSPMGSERGWGECQRPIGSQDDRH
jgi:hypothetical protein